MSLLRLLLHPGLAWEATVHSLPGPTGDRLRNAYWSRRLGHMGKNVRIGPGAHFTHPEKVRLEDDCWVDRNVTVLAGTAQGGRKTTLEAVEGFPLQPGEVRIGQGTHVAPNCVLSGLGGLSIGARSGIAAGTAVFSLAHEPRNGADPGDPNQYLCTPRVPKELQAMRQGPVWIEDDCGIGANSVLLPGTHLRRGTWVGAATVLRGGTHGPQAVVSNTPRNLATQLDLRLPPP